MRILLLILAMMLRTAQTEGQAVTVTLEGTAVNALTLQPIPNVAISVTPAGSASPSATATTATANTVTRTLLSQAVAAQAGAPEQINILTDSSGRFLIPAIAPGPYVIGALLEGYFGPEIVGVRAPGVITNVRVAEKQNNDVTLAMFPGGTIGGHILDDLGMPATNISVQLLRVTYNNGVPTAQSGGTGATDDRGTYRVFGMMPGEYYIAANPKQALGGGVRGEPAVPVLPSPVRTFFPSATDLSQASIIKVRAGEEIAGIDISIKTAAGARISGQVVSSIPGAEGGATGPPNSIITMFFHDKNALQDSNSAASVSVSMGDPANGRFEIPNVLPGVYDLYASLPDNTGFGARQPRGEAGQPLIFGRTTIDIHGGDQDEVRIAVHHGIDIKGRVTIDGGPSPSINNVRISLQADDSASKIPVYQQVGRFQPMIDPDGSFTIPAVPEAHYRFQITFAPPPPAPSTGAGRGGTTPASSNTLATVPLAGSPLSPNSYVADILQTGMSVYDNGIFVGTQNIEPLEIRVKTDGGSVDGIVNATSRKPAAGATVVLVPPVAHRLNPALYKIATSDASGRFSITAIPPGEYKMFAWESIPPGAYMNADVLKNYAEKAVSITVSASIQHETQVTLIPADR